jgi:biotin-dependent carboxylase-like uncharacterized protein
VSRCLEVVATGVSTTVQDLGRPGYGHLGVSRSGAADRSSAGLANRLVGNVESAAVLEVTLGGLAVRADADVLVATAGARSPASVDGRAVGHGALVELHAGQTLRLAVPVSGLRTYLGVRGGIDVPTVLGSRATDLLGGIGPPVVREGDRLPLGEPVGEVPTVDVAPVPEPPAGEVELRVHRGPRADWFTLEARELVVGAAWTAGPDSSRTGLRLLGPTLDRVRDEELPTEGLVRGALQVPPSGPPTLFLADHPVTGGYPVVAVVVDADVDRAAQVRPGQTVRFRAVTTRGS